MLFCVWVVFVSVLNTCSCGSFRLASHKCYDRPFSDGYQGFVFLAPFQKMISSYTSGCFSYVGTLLCFSLLFLLVCGVGCFECLCVWLPSLSVA